MSAVAADHVTYTITWVPGRDEMVAICHCGARRTGDEPIVLWQWLLAHTNGHVPLDGDTSPSDD